MSKKLNFLDRIEVGSILSQHLTTFYHYEKKRFNNKIEIPKSDYILFLWIPVMISFFLCWVGLKFTIEYVNISLTCLSIFIGLLFGLLTMVFGMISENQKTDTSIIKLELVKKQEAKNDLTKHLFINIAFSIVLSICLLCSILLTQFYPVKLINLIKGYEFFILIKAFYLYTTNGISFFLLIEFFLTLMMVVKRFTVLFLNQISEH